MTYTIPFPEGTPWERAIPTGDYAHENFPESFYAWDFLVDIGTPVMAARKGRIQSVKRGSTTWINPRESMQLKDVQRLAEEYTNLVCIDHEDGTFAEYLHLASEIPVRADQRVERGDLLGYTGWSGVMDKLHLHFNVFRIEEGKAISIPFEFADK